MQSDPISTLSKKQGSILAGVSSIFADLLFLQVIEKHTHFGAAGKVLPICVADLGCRSRGVFTVQRYLSVFTPHRNQIIRLSRVTP